MKAIALICVGTMLLLGASHLLDTLQLSGAATEVACCDNCCDPDEGHPNGTDPCDTDADCLPDCNCSSHFQITAITYRFVEMTSVTVQSYHYGHYMNSYSFEYNAPFLHPPRLG